MYGKLGRSKSGTWVMMFPEIEMIEQDADAYVHLDRITPIYNLTDGLTQMVMRRIMFERDAEIRLYRAGILSRTSAHDVAAGSLSRDPFSRLVPDRGTRAAAARLRRILRPAMRGRLAPDGAGHGAPASFGQDDRSGETLARLAAVYAYQCPATRDGRNRRRSRPRPADEPAAAGRCRRGKNLRRRLRHAARGRGGRTGGADGPDANPGRAARAESAPLAGAARRSGRSFHRQHAGKGKKRPAAGRRDRSVQFASQPRSQPVPSSSARMRCSTTATRRTSSGSSSSTSSTSSACCSGSRSAARARIPTSSS